MNADERIEKLLNHFGQTISDLPKGRDYLYKDKLIVSMQDATRQAFDWFNPELGGEFDLCGLNAYICHLADVIDRMEVALETALSCCYCEYCAHSIEEEDGVVCDDCLYDGESRFRIKDEEFTEYDEWLLTDRSEDEHDHPSEG